MIAALIAGFLAILVFIPHPGALKHGWDQWGGNAGYYNAVWADRWFYFACLFAALQAVQIGIKKHWSIGLLFGYVAISAAWVFGWHGVQLPTEYETKVLKLDAAMAYAALVSAASILPWINWTWSRVRGVGTALAVACLFESIVTIWQWGVGMPAMFRGGLLGNPSLSGCFIAFTLPFLVPRMRWMLWIPVIAILSKGTSQPIGALAVAALAYFTAENRLKIRREWIKILWFGTLCVLIVSFVIPLTTQKKDRPAFDDSGRFHIWHLIITPWWHDGGTRAHLLGMGTGSTSALLFHYQEEEEKTRHKPGEPFRTMYWDNIHNDFLQILIENGIIGLALALIAAWFSLALAWRKSAHLFSAWCTYLSCCIFNPPTHWPVHALAGAIILAMVFEPLKSWNASSLRL